MTNSGTTQPETWTILRLLQWTTEYLSKHKSSTPRLDAELLLAHARSCQRIELYAAFDQEPDESIKSIFRDLVRRRAAGEPVAYLVGKKEFYSLEFTVSKDCLIPRSETEHLVMECLDRAKKTPGTTHVADQTCNQQRIFRIADVCTGSGCIAIAIAKHLPNCQIIATDISQAALAIASSNVDYHHVQDRVRLIESDLLSNVDENSLDFVISNPPYVSESELATLDRSVRDYEPHLALVAGPTGTEMIERLIHQSASQLTIDGWFLCELSPMIAARVEETLTSSRHWTNVTMIKDLAGLTRIAAAQKAS